MHIPDSVLSPSTSATTALLMVPVWAAAGRQVHKKLGSRQIPLLAMGSAFCFTIMMFNIPALGGTTAHPVAGTLLAVLLGPWAAVIGVSVALAIQALLFGDGGLLAYGANCFSMAFVLPFTGYAAYRLLFWLMGKSERARPLAAAFGSFFGINAAACIVALLLGIQPALFHEANGHALYFPFGVAVTFPAMLGAHLLVAGPAEAIVTGMVVRYLQSAAIPLHGASSSVQSNRTSKMERVWIGLLALLALCPLGLLAKGSAWGEWDAQELSNQIAMHGQTAYIPKNAMSLDEKSFKGASGLQDYASERGSKGYLTAAFLGAGLILCIVGIVGKIFMKQKSISAPSLSRSNLGRKDEKLDDDVSALPGWMMHAETAASTQPSRKEYQRNRYLELTLSSLTQRHAASMKMEAMASKDGVLQRLKPQYKILISLFLILILSALHSFALLASLYLLLLFTALKSKLPIVDLVKRVWAFVVLFAGVIILPAALNTVTPGREIIVLWNRPHLSITQAGVTIASVLLMKIAISVTIGTILTLSTKWSALLKGLALLNVPTVFLTILAMTHRYLIVLMQTASEMFTARQSRMVGRQSNSQSRSFVGAGVGVLFGKSQALSEEIHSAMVSRGFRGQFKQLESYVHEAG